MMNTGIQPVLTIQNCDETISYTIGKADYTSYTVTPVHDKSELLFSNLVPVGWMWEEYYEELCEDENDWYVQFSTIKPHVVLTGKHMIRNVRVIYAEKGFK